MVGFWVSRGISGSSHGPERAARSATGSQVARFGPLRLIFHPIPQPAVNNLPLVAHRLFFLHACHANAFR